MNDGKAAETSGTEGEGEDLPHVSDGPEDERPEGARDDDRPDLDQIADATTRLLRTRPLTEAEMAEVMRAAAPIPIGVMGWCAKVGAVVDKKSGKKAAPGMRISGQICSAGSVRGKFGVQQYVTIAGRYKCPKHVNTQGEVIKAVDEAGRWLLAIDATLTELPSHVGDVVDVELDKRGGSGVRHAYAKVNIWLR